MDSGCTGVHMTPYLSDIHDPISDTSCAMTGALKGPPITSSHSGSVIGDLLDKNGNFLMDAKIKRVVYFKNATRRLLSVSLLERDGWNFESNKGNLSRGKTVIPLVKTGGLYVMRVKKSKKTRVANAVSPARNDFMLWHHRLGHVNQHSLRDMVSKEQWTDIKLSDSDMGFCETCPIGKIAQNPGAT